MLSRGKKFARFLLFSGSFHFSLLFFGFHFALSQEVSVVRLVKTCFFQKPKKAKSVEDKKKSQVSLA